MDPIRTRSRGFTATTLQWSRPTESVSHSPATIKPRKVLSSANPPVTARAFTRWRAAELEIFRRRYVVLVGPLTGNSFCSKETRDRGLTCGPWRAGPQFCEGTL